MSDIAVGTDGKPCNSTPLGSWIIPVSIRQSATTAASATVWSMRNAAASGKYVYIRRIHLVCAFDGTAAASTSQWEVGRFSTATPTGGTAITPFKKSSALSVATAVTDARFVDTGLTVTSVVFEGALIHIGVPRQVGATSDFPCVFDVGGNERYDALILAPGEGLGIRIVNTAVIGDSIRGFIEWDERVDP